MISCNGETTESGKKYKYLHNKIFSFLKTEFCFFKKKHSKPGNPNGKYVPHSPEWKLAQL